MELEPNSERQGIPPPDETPVPVAQQQSPSTYRPVPPLIHMETTASGDSNNPSLPSSTRRNQVSLAASGDSNPSLPSSTRRNQVSLASGDSNPQRQSLASSTSRNQVRVNSQLDLKLPALAKFSGEERDDGDTFDRWVRRLEKHAELQQWSERGKLLQFELHLVGRAERVYEVLPAELKQTFDVAVTSLSQRLHPVKRQALTSAQLIKRKQKVMEPVDDYAQEFECLFDKSYGQRSGMDQESKELLKRDLFVQGLLPKWQEKVLPSAETFYDALYQARVAEEQEKQLAAIHTRPEPRPFLKKFADQRDRPQSYSPAKESHPARDRSNRGGTKATPVIVPSHRSEQKGNHVSAGRCYGCRSQEHGLRECPLHRPPPEASGRT